AHPELAEDPPEIDGEVEIGIQPRSVGLGWSHLPRRPSAGVSQPSSVAVKSSNAVAVGSMHDGDALIRGFGHYFNRHLASASVDGPFLHTAGNFLQGFGAARSLDVF